MLTEKEKYNIIKSMFHNITAYFHELGYTVKINIQEYVTGYRILEFHYFSPDTGITALINFLATGASGEVNGFYGIFRKHGSLDLDLGKYIKLNFGEEALSTLRTGPVQNFTEAIKMPIQLIEDALKEEMKSILKGENWNIKYYKPWHEGTDY
jgi:hypothetical protein